ncbi:MAG TPA: conjugal transfer protein TraX [Lachnospiraceae bacterium]|nr:conjugal transfer protein TraX [Lachnospiraceae bacterium]
MPETNAAPAQKSHRLPIGLSGAALKYIAVITMLIDHFALVVVLYGFIYNGRMLLIRRHDILPSLYDLMRQIGRVAFPIFLFLLVQGFIHTRSRKKYAVRLFLFACLSELPFNLAVSRTLFSFSYQNVFWTLLAGFLMMCLLEKIQTSEMPRWAAFLASLLVVAGLCWAVTVGHTDYSYHGILSVLLLYLFRYEKWMTLLAGAVSFAWEPAAIIAFLPIALYNGEKGRAPKYFFYAFYPVHLLALVGINYVLFHHL